MTELQFAKLAQEFRQAIRYDGLDAFIASHELPSSVYEGGTETATLVAVTQWLREQELSIDDVSLEASKARLSKFIVEHRAPGMCRLLSVPGKCTCIMCDRDRVFEAQEASTWRP